MPKLEWYWWAAIIIGAWYLYRNFPHTCPPCEQWVKQGWEWEAGCYPIYPPPAGECLQRYLQRTGERPQFYA